ncbi:MAG: FAD-dependent oxidoreductase [Pseudomonadota bacterium]
MQMERLATDILILGAGGAGLMAALHAKQANPDLEVTVAVKGLLGKSGCTRMVQGGYNVALSPGDSIERHFQDTIEGGKWLPRQDLAWALVTGAVTRIQELENEYGCFFDRNTDGTLHQKAFAGQSFDRTAHKADLTGIEIMNRLMEQARAHAVRPLEEHRAVELIPAADGTGIAGALLIDIRSGAYRFVQARTVLLATGAGPTMYRYHTPSGDKACDGLAMALRAGLALRDMEMVQFHPTGLLGGPDTRMTGTVLEEGLRGAGGHLLNGARARFMADYHPAAERATRDVVSRGIYAEMRAGRTTPMGGVYISMGHLGAESVARKFPGMVKRCADCGFDLAGGLVEVVPTAHYMMGGIEVEPDCTTTLPGLYVAGEDAGGIHGANRLGGNGVANSTVFGGIAGDQMAAAGRVIADPDLAAIDRAVERCEAAFAHPATNLHALREALAHAMWDDVGVMRTAEGLAQGLETVRTLRAEIQAAGIGDTLRSFNLTWHDRMNLESLAAISEVIATAALAREDSRGAHFREDFPKMGGLTETRYTRIRADGEALALEAVPVAFTIIKPGESLIEGEAGAPVAAE